MLDQPDVGDRGSVTGIILAGGASRRMGGVNKALLKVGETAVIQRVVDVVSQIFEHVVIITNNPDPYAFLGLPTHPDILPGQGSLGGLLTGLHVAATPRGFLVACDMPFLKPAIVRHMLNLDPGFDVVIPRIRGLLEPLHAIYSKDCIPHIRRLLDAGDLKILNLFPRVRVLEVPESDLTRFDPDLNFAMNLNTPADFERAREMAGKHSS